jgi:hypothetical protein
MIIYLIFALQTLLSILFETERSENITVCFEEFILEFNPL